MKRICFAGGCFWGVEKYLSLIPGISHTSACYANGKTDAPTYEDVCYRDTGHAEAVMVEYDEETLSLNRLLELFYNAIDPTSINRQGHDIGVQYRSGIYYLDESDKEIISRSIEQLQRSCTQPVAIEVKLLNNCYPAEEYHQEYLDKNPAGYCHIGAAKFDQAKRG